MAFRDFRFRALARVVFLVLVLLSAGYSWFFLESAILSLALLVVLVIQVFELYRFITHANRQLIRFLESIKYSDFASGFSSGNELGLSFRDLNASFNDVLNAIRKARSEKEEHWQYLNTVVEHVSVGVISFDTEGNVGLINAAAKRLMGIGTIRNIEELIESNSWLYKALFDLPAGKSTLHKTRSDIQLSFHATEIKLAGTPFKLVAIQNIQPELQKKELEAWQNLTRILRHEIMNSIAPIASLTSTMKDILAEDIQKKDENYYLEGTSVEDLEEGLGTIEDRSKGLIKFINAYRDYTSIPQPDLKPIEIMDLLSRVDKLMRSDLTAKGIELRIDKGANPEIMADEEQIEQVLINMVKNSAEALEDVRSPTILLSARTDEEGSPCITVEDNGAGIIREALEKIFIPFYTTKSTGSGIGLALSRQIMQLHHGSVHVESEPGRFTRFTLRF